MGRPLRFLLIQLALACLAAAPAGAALLDSEVRDAQGQPLPLQRVVAGQQAIVMLVDPASSEARAWLARTLAQASPEVQRNVVVVLASHRPLGQWPELDLAKSPTVRVYMDAAGQLARGGEVRVFPSVLGLGANGQVRSRLAGPMAMGVNLNAFSGHLRGGVAR